MNWKRGFWITLWVVLVVVTGFLAFGSGTVGMGYGPWHHWGRMGAWEMDRDYRGAEAHALYGMGPWMMGGHGAMMTGIGPGMWGSRYNTMMPWWPPDLTAQQSEKIGQLHGEFIQRNRDLLQQSWEAQDRLNRLYAAEKRDWDAIRTASQHVFDLQRQQMDAAIDIQQKIDGLLTDSQRQQMTRAWAAYGRMGAQ